MSRIDNKRIAQETLQIIERGYYELDGRRVDLEYGEKFSSEVDVVPPFVVADIFDDVDEFIDENLNEYPSCEYQVVNMDSYEAVYKLALSDKVLVLNFANAHHPGGGFLSGASAQEESLCRCSSLFASINSKKAREMYDYNNENPDPFDSEYMLISPYVNVFRSADGNLLPECFFTAVITVPAPNLYGRAKNVDKVKLEAMMQYKIESILLITGKLQYDTLVLGAWGCGAFGHDAKNVAETFQDVIVNMGYHNHFRKIIFAVYDKTPEQYNYRCFLDTFGRNGIWEKE